MGHKSAEGIPSYIFKTKIIPKLSGKEIRWDINQDGKNRIQTVGPLFRPQNTDNPEKGEIQSGLKMAEMVSFFSKLVDRRLSESIFPISILLKDETLMVIFTHRAGGYFQGYKNAKKK